MNKVTLITRSACCLYSYLRINAPGVAYSNQAVDESQSKMKDAATPQNDSGGFAVNATQNSTSKQTRLFVCYTAISVADVDGIREVAVRQKMRLVISAIKWDTLHNVV